jgi:catechol 2,3-dioxygenase-like lactoylglutathione lyase family enzyme
MIDHISLGVRDVRRAAAFYDAVLAPLGMKSVMRVDLPGRSLLAVGYGQDEHHPTFWVQLPVNGDAASAGNGVHVAFAAANHAAVDAFYLAAMESGGSDEGGPGHRVEYHPHYYGAFVRDPDGNKIEACCHAPE